MNKREFVLGACAAAFSGGGLMAAPPAAAAVAVNQRGLRLPALAEAPSLATWQRYLNQSFEVEIAGKRRRLTLTAVQAEVFAAPLTQFTLVFDTSGQPWPTEGTHVLRHATGQRVPVYLQPTLGAGGAAAYQAHFSLLG